MSTFFYDLQSNMVCIELLMWPCAFLFWHVNAKEILVLFCEACVSTNFVKSFLLRFWGAVWSIYSATISVEISYVCKFDLMPGAIWGSIDWMLDYKATENKKQKRGGHGAIYLKILLFVVHLQLLWSEKLMLWFQGIKLYIVLLCLVLTWSAWNPTGTSPWDCLSCYSLRSIPFHCVLWRCLWGFFAVSCLWVYCEFIVVSNISQNCCCDTCKLMLPLTSDPYF